MRVLLINKYHYRKGGTETFKFNLAEALEELGHEVVFFSMRNKKNEPGLGIEYFIDEIDYNDPNLGFWDKARLASKLIYSRDAKRHIEQLLDAYKPDIAHIGLIHRQLTFSVVDALVERKIPIVMHLHELSAVCPCYTMLQPNGAICQECLGGHFSHCVEHKCMKKSRAKSILAYLEARFLAHQGYYDKINAYIAECDFYKQLAVKSGFTSSPIYRLNNFLPVNQSYSIGKARGNYILYFGRFSREKGVLTLLEAYKMLNPKEDLLLVGAGNEKESIELFVKDNSLNDKVRMVGPTFGNAMDEIIADATLVVVPSEWYENGAFVALQSMAKGKVVVASDIAGLGEIFSHGENGFLFEPGNPNSLAEVLDEALSLDDLEKDRMSQAIVSNVKDRCDWKAYMDELLSIYSDLIAEG